MSAKPLPAWAKHYTEAGALVAARKLLGPGALVKRTTCAPFTTKGATTPTCCTGFSGHRKGCLGDPPRPMYRVMANVFGMPIVRGVGSTWAHALAAAAFGDHRFGCMVCDGMGKCCEKGAPLFEALAAATPPDGLIQYRRARDGGLPVGVYYSVDAGIEVDPETPYATVCEDHGGVVCHATLALALSWAPMPKTWCPTCQEQGVQHPKFDPRADPRR